MQVVSVVGGRPEVSWVHRPRPAAGEVLVRVTATTVGRADLDVVHGVVGPVRARAARPVPGSEFVGTVAAPGAGVDGWPLGRAVAVHPTGDDVRAGLLGRDRDGGWADYVAVPAASLVPLPPDLEPERAAVLPVTVATPWSALTRTARVRPGESVAIWGTGGLGGQAVALARMIGAAPVVGIDPVPAARERALRAGADAVLDPDDADFARDLATLGAGFDVAIEMSGAAAARAQCAEALSERGRAVLVGTGAGGLTIASADGFVRSGRSVIAYRGSTVGDLAAVVRLARLGRLDPSASVERVRGLDEIASVVDEADRCPGEWGRTVLRPAHLPGDVRS